MEHILKFLLSPWAWAMGFLWPLATQTLIAAELMASGITAWALAQPLPWHSRLSCTSKELDMDQVADRDLDGSLMRSSTFLSAKLQTNIRGSCHGAPWYGVSAIVSFFSRCSRWSLQV